MKSIAADHREQTGKPDTFWITFFSVTFFSVAFYTSMEWLYFVTKPSFMSGMNAWVTIKTWLQTNFAVFLAAFCLLVFLFLGDRIIAVFSVRQIIRWIAGLFPVFFIGITILLLIDNFTYTLFRIGIVSTTGVFRGIYAAGFLFLLFRLYQKLVPYLHQNPGSSQKSRLLWIPVLVLAFSLVLTIFEIPPQFDTKSLIDTGRVKAKPNIILLGSDGLSARNLSLYGYSRETTPYLKSLSSEALLMTNHLSNSGNTPGSVASLFTGRLPSKTRVGYPPDRLRAADSYQHLPGILKELGYTSIEIAVPHYLDATELNLLDGFDRVNEKSVNSSLITRKMRAAFSNDIVFFLETIYERILTRLSHVFYIRQMVNPYHIVTQTTDTRYDEERLTELSDIITECNQPFFVQIHLLGTHGGLFNTGSSQFSGGKVQDKEWMTDFYDDALLDFDGYVKKVVQTLKDAGKLDQTILIIYTDHAQRWNPLDRIPLMIRFPNGEFAGTIGENTQNLDISPTILDYMGIPQPSWMDGQSLLNGNPPALRPIISANVEKTETTGDGNKYHFDSMKPPFYQFDNFTETVCQKWVRLNTVNGQWTDGTLDGRPGLCVGVEVPSTSQMARDLLTHLKDDGFDVSSIDVQE